MKNIYRIILVLVIIAAYTWGCKKPYNAPAINDAPDYLVVEGVIDVGQDTTLIKLSRTVEISSGMSANPELQAIVTVEGDDNTSYPLQEYPGGRYIAVGLNLNAGRKYRLKITTYNNKTYQSDFVEVKNSPAIDSITFKATSGGVSIYANTHDPANKTIYYRWSFKETYLFHAAFQSYMKLVTFPVDTIVFRSPDEQIYRCWRGDSSTNIVLGSSAKLQQDVISQSQLTSITTGSEKLEDRYSILVTQYALTKDAFDYWQNLKKNTEQLGSIFDAQPSEISGNIHCLSNPSEPVIGYISAGTRAQLRKFIDNRDIPAWHTPITGCIDTVFAVNGVDGLGRPTHPAAENIYPGFYLPLSAISQPGGPITGYHATTRECGDCTLRGTNVRPAFWKDY